MENEINAGLETQETALESEIDTSNATDNNSNDEIKTFTQTELDAIIKERLERQTASFLKRVGLESMDGIDDLVNRSKEYDSMKELNTKSQLENQNLRMEIAFLKNNIRDEKIDDIKTYFKGKDLDFSDEALKDALQTHPEWLQQQPKQTTITKFASQEPTKPTYDEHREAMKLFGLE